MPAIRDWTSNFNTSAATTLTSYLPKHQAGDLLLAILSNDTPSGTQVWTSLGFSPVGLNVTNTSNLTVLYKIATGLETDPVFAYTTSTTAMVHLIAIQDVNTSTPFNGTGGAGTGYISSNTSSVRGTMPQLTTTVNNSLIIYVNADSTSGPTVPVILEGPCTYESGVDDTNHSQGFAWGFQSIAGATPNNVYYTKLNASPGILATIGISPPASGATIVPAHCVSDSSIYIDPLNGTTAYNGNDPVSAAQVTNYFTSTLNGITLSAASSVTSVANVGINPYHSLAQISGEIGFGSWSGATLVVSNANKPNVSGKNVLVHVRPSDAKVLKYTNSINYPVQPGIAFGMCSTNNSALRVWHTHGAGTKDWDNSNFVPMVINDQYSGSGRIQNGGTLDAGNIKAFGFFISGHGVSPSWQWGSLWALDTTVVSGGTSTTPVRINDLVDIVATGKERYSMILQGASQALLMQPLQLGNGGVDSLYIDLDDTTIEIPSQYNLDTSTVHYCSVDNVAGIKYFAGPGDTVIHSDAIVTSTDRFHWGFTPGSASSATATYDFDELSIVGAGNITLQANIDLYGVTFNHCDQITSIGNTLTACEFYETRATSGQGAFAISASSQSALQAKLDKLVSVTFANCSSSSGALKIEYTGSAQSITLTTESISFFGNSKDIYWVAPSSSPLIFKQYGTSGATTSTATNSNTVTLETMRSLKITNISDGSQIKVLKKSDLSVLASADVVGSSPSGLDNITVGNDPVDLGKYTATYEYPYTGSDSVYVVVFKPGHIPLRPEFVLTSNNTQLRVDQQIDRQYANPA
jgi:hypothetical protein